MFLRLVIGLGSFVALAASTQASADVFTRLDNCKTSCSQQCVDFAKDVRRAAKDTIDECDRVTPPPRPRPRPNPGPRPGDFDKIASYRACDDALGGFFNEQQCKGLVDRYSINARRVNACDKAMDGKDYYTLQCLEIVGQRDLSVRDIEYCDESASGEFLELACMRNI